MLDKVLGLFGQLKFLGPILSQIPMVVGLIEKIMRKAIAKEDAKTIGEACAQWYLTSATIRVLLDEVDEVFMATEHAVADEAVSFAEIKTVTHEARDVGPVAADVMERFGKVIGTLKKLAD